MRYLDNGSIVVMIITALLFVWALFLKGLQHDLLLEAGVFLVSVKLMIMAYKLSQQHLKTQQTLDEILRRLSQKE
jgi:NADH:ubiquinone oxidoreductase subunit 3 (subunit A)